MDHDRLEQMSDYLEFLKKKRDELEEYYISLVADITEQHNKMCPCPRNRCLEKFTDITVTAVTSEGLYEHFINKHRKLSDAAKS